MPRPFVSDWSNLIQSENVSRLYPAPLVEEAGALIEQGAKLWPGRVRGSEMHAFGRELRGTAEEWIRRAMSWADPLLIQRNRDDIEHRDSDEACGHLFHDRLRLRGLLRGYERAEETDEAAARRLVDAGFALARMAAPFIRVTGDHLYRDKTADAFEDKLEVMRESVVAERPDMPTPAEAIRHLAIRGANRTAYAIARTMESIANSVEGKKHVSLEAGWKERCEAYIAPANDAYDRFMESCPGQEHAALCRARLDDWSSPEWRKHYSTRDQLLKSGALAEAVIEALRPLLDGQPERLLTQRVAAAPR